MFIYTHKGINFWWVFAWNIFVLQVGNYLRQSLKTYGQSRSDYNDISEFPLPHNMFTVQNRIVVVFGLLLFFLFFCELDICLNFVKVRKHRSKLMTRIKEHYIELTPHSPKNPPKTQTNKKRTVGLLHFKTI